MKEKCSSYGSKLAGLDAAIERGSDPPDEEIIVNGLDDMGEGREKGLRAGALRVNFLPMGTEFSGDGLMELVGKETTPKLEPEGEIFTSENGEPKADLRTEVDLKEAGSKELRASRYSDSPSSSCGEC